MKLVPSKLGVLAEVVNDKDARTAFGGILFEFREGGSVRGIATDGSRLVIADVKAEYKQDDFPKLDGINANGAEFQKVLLPAKMFYNLAKTAPAKPVIPPLGCVAISMDEDGKRVKLATTDLSSVKIESAQQIEGEFPDYQSVIPTGEPSFEISFNARLLRQTLNTIEKLLDKGAKEIPAVKFSFYGATKVAKIKGENKKAGTEVTSLIMPVTENK